MIREKLIDKGVGDPHKFRWRSHEISRIEGLSDAVFAFAVTLLVVSDDGARHDDRAASQKIRNTRHARSLAGFRFLAKIISMARAHNQLLLLVCFDR
jgi:hypothetical protein